MSMPIIFQCLECGSTSYFVSSGCVFCSKCGNVRKSKEAEMSTWVTCAYCDSRSAYAVEGSDGQTFYCVKCHKLFFGEIERKIMTDRELYVEMQARWVKENNVEEGDIVKVLRVPIKQNELGSNCGAAIGFTKDVGKEFFVEDIFSDRIVLGTWSWPFFCLEFVKKTKPKIEISVKVNNKTVPLSTLSEETILNIWRNS